MKGRRALGVALFTLFLIGCAADPTLRRLPERDGPPKTDAVDVSEVPDAVPRDEPLSKHGNPDVYEVLGRTYDVMENASGYSERGYASWYGRKFHGRRTSSGETYDMYKMTAAHRTLPLPSYLRVTNLRNDRQVIVRVNDRGPFHSERILDLSYAAAVRLDMIGEGTAPVRVQLIEPGEDRVADSEDPVLYLQAGAFGDAKNARRLAQRLRDLGLERVFVAPTDDPEPLYRVRVGPYADAATLAESRRTLERNGLKPAALRD